MITDTRGDTTSALLLETLGEGGVGFEQTGWAPPGCRRQQFELTTFEGLLRPNLWSCLIPTLMEKGGELVSMTLAGCYSTHETGLWAGEDFTREEELLFFVSVLYHGNVPVILPDEDDDYADESSDEEIIDGEEDEDSDDDGDYIAE